MSKRSIGVTIFAWLIIAGSVLSLLSAVANVSVNPRISTYFYLAIAPLSLIAGIFLLRLSKAARITIILISILVATESVLTAQYAMQKTEEQLSVRVDGPYGDRIVAEIKQKNPQLTDNDTLRIKEMIKERSKPLVRNFFYIALGLSLGFNFAVIYFFNRPKVIAQFR